MRVLLTGCHGFIGRNVNDALMERDDVDSSKIGLFGQVRFGRFDDPFGSIDNAHMGDGGPPCEHET